MTCFYQFFNPVKAVCFNMFYFLHDVLLFTCYMRLTPPIIPHQSLNPFFKGNRSASSNSAF